VGSLQGLVGKSKGQSDSPVYIKSDTLDLNSKSRIFSYRGNVEVKRDDLIITAKVIDGYYTADNKIEKMIAKDNVVVTRGEGLRSVSNRAIYKVDANIIELTEKPELFKDGSVLAADKITIYVKEDRSEAEGNVRVRVVKQPGASTR
jgi:lipopolysaccharide transport protein LptA